MLVKRARKKNILYKFNYHICIYVYLLIVIFIQKIRDVPIYPRKKNINNLLFNPKTEYLYFSKYNQSLLTKSRN